MSKPELPLMGIEQVLINKAFLVAKDAEIDRLRDLLRKAEEALSDLGACDDPDCTEDTCNHALSLIRAELQ